MRIIDISLPIHPGMPAYPGTLETSFEAVQSKSGSSFLTNVSMSSHTGTHIDAPAHVKAGDATVDAFDLSLFYGPCRVLDMLNCPEGITVDVLKQKDVHEGERLLFKTQNSVRGFNEFHEQWVGLTSEGAEYLGQFGVALVGIDWFGIKHPGAADNRAHSELLRRGIPILEGLNLSAAQEGIYTLSAFPLALQGIDGAPARAVLIQP